MRRFSPWSLAGLAFGLAILEAAAFEPNRLRVKRVNLQASGCGVPSGDLRLAHLSDLHVGGTGWRRGPISRAIRVCNQERLDLIVITGDLIGSEAGAEGVLEMLSSLRRDVPRLAVLGNHDYVHGGRSLATLRRGLDRMGVTVLCNEAICLELPSGPIWFAGVDDGYSMRDDLDMVRRKMGSGNGPRVLLTHYPDVADRLHPGEFQLSLAGHSHGGQIRVPLLDGLVCNSHARTRYGRGLYTVNGNPLYVSSGLGMSGVSLRFRNWPEMGLLTLPLMF